MSEYGSNANITGTLIVDGEIDLGSGAASALNGLMVYEEDTHRLKIIANGAWQTIEYDQ